MSLISWNIRFYCASLKLYSMKIHLSLTNAMRENGELVVFFDFLLTVKAAPHECVIRTGQPKT